MEKLPLNHIKVMLAERMLTNKKLVKILGKAPATISEVDNQYFETNLREFD